MENIGLMILLSHKDHLDHIFSWCKPALTPLASLEGCQIYTTEELWPSVPLHNTPCLLSHLSTNCTWMLCCEAVLHTLWPLEREIPYSFSKFSEKPLGKLKATQTGDLKSFLDFDQFLQGFSCLQGMLSLQFSSICSYLRSTGTNMQQWIGKHYISLQLVSCPGL